MVAVGIDACKAGWVAVVLRPGQHAQAHLLTSIDELARAVPDVTVAGIDIPVGLLASGVRAADTQAKQALGARRSSVFVTPIRAALEAHSHAEATQIAQRVTGSGISQQAFGLRSNIFEVERWLVDASCDVYEVHPEVSFAGIMGHPATASKKTWQGMIERRAALAEAGIVLDDVDALVGAKVGTDDMLDAGAAAWTAARLLAGTAHSIPDRLQRSDTGRAIAIWV